MAEYKTVVLPEATKETMLKEQYRLCEIGKEEWEIFEMCNEIDEKLEKIDEYRRIKSKCNNGYKNRRR